MAEMTQEQLVALRMLVDAIMEAVAAAGPMGAPGGVMYAALMTHGCKLTTFESLMGSLVRLGKLRKSGELYFIEPEIVATDADGGA